MHDGRWLRSEEISRKLALKGMPGALEGARQVQQALEVVNGMMPPEQVGTMSILTREFGLLVSAGSDFHGPGGWSEIGQYRPVPEDLPPLWCRFKHDTDIAAV